MNGENYIDVLPDAELMNSLPPVLSAAGIARIFKKSKNTVMMRVYKGDLGAYRDGRLVQIYTIGAVSIWGLPEGKRLS